MWGVLGAVGWGSGVGHWGGAVGWGSGVKHWGGAVRGIVFLFGLTIHWKMSGKNKIKM